MISLSLHALAAIPFSLSAPSFASKSLLEESIPISYVQVSPPPSRETSPALPLYKAPSLSGSRPAEKKKNPPAPLPAHRDRQRLLKAVIRHSGELLTDPRKGKIFSNYFVMVKEKIRQTVRRRSSDGETGSGSVSLFFVLNSEGRLETASVLENQSRADAFLKKFALECLKEAAPFASFPARLGVGSISFSVIVAFDEETS